ncbi:MAG: S66 peptidase family protein [Chloroflexota bacterium]|nr:S66 peptidase family protein [Chloroflexota bacterium]
MIKPPRLRIGDTIGVVSPSWGGGAAFPHRVERGAHQLESLGFRITYGRHAFNSSGHVSDTPENRVDDIHAMFDDPMVKAIISTIGGDHSCHLLPLLDFDLIRSKPKVFMGFSDMTVLNVAIHVKTGLVTFNGSHVMTDFAEYPAMPAFSEGSFMKTVTDPSPIGALDQSTWWTDEILDWESKQDLTRPREQHVSEGWTWLKPGQGTGALIGGCLESLQHLRGTPFWPRWHKTILFLETSEEKPPPETVDGILQDYENMGVFDEINGLLFGRPMLYSAEERQQLRDVILKRTHRFPFPVVTDMDYGHTTPTLTLPLGCRALIDSDRKLVEIIEGAVG